MTGEKTEKCNLCLQESKMSVLTCYIYTFFTQIIQTFTNISDANLSDLHSFHSMQGVTLFTCHNT